MKRLLSLLVLFGILLGRPAFAAPSSADMVKMLQVIDDRQRNSGDYTSVVYIETKQSGKADLVYLAEVYRRDESDKLVILFTKPLA